MRLHDIELTQSGICGPPPVKESSVAPSKFTQTTIIGSHHATLWASYPFHLHNPKNESDRFHCSGYETVATLFSLVPHKSHNFGDSQ